MDGGIITLWQRLARQIGVILRYSNTFRFAGSRLFARTSLYLHGLTYCVITEQCVCTVFVSLSHFNL
jgi:hypothetical protein